METSLNISKKPNLIAEQFPLSKFRKRALLAGLLYVLTFISIPTLSLYQPIHQPNYVSTTAGDNNVIIGGLLEIIVALSGIATAVVLYPVLKKQNETLAIGLVATRVLEASTMFLGVAFLITSVSLRQEGEATAATGHALVTLYDRIFLLGQGFIPALNDLLLGFLLYKARLVPRGLSLIGILGALPLIIGYLAILFGCIELRSYLSGLSAVMVAVFEFSLGIYLIVKGFKTSYN
jgi:hypothetical protein